MNDIIAHYLYIGRSEKMRLSLSKATILDCAEIHNLQITSFRQLQEKYQNGPGAEKPERTMQKMQESFTDYYFICLYGKHIGGLRICHFANLCKLKQIFILPEYQEHGYAQEAIALVESLYPKTQKWELDTIEQEDKLCYLYEKMGYKKTGKTQKIKDGMDIVYYAK